MRKIIISAAAAVMALSTTASALEDIKVNGQAKVWYESSDKGAADLLNKNGASGEVVFKLGMTGKQGNVGFGATVYQNSTMGLEGGLVSAARTNAVNGAMYVGEAYITTPISENTLLKFGKQELQTPLAFTEKWNASPNTFNAAVAINSSLDNVTIIGAYVGQDNTNLMNSTGTALNGAAWKSDGEVSQNYFGAGATTFALGALYKNNGLAVNAWAYEISTVAKAFWVDAAVNVANVNVKAYAATMMASDSVKALFPDDTTAFALSAGTAVSGVKLFAAASMVSDDAGIPVANTSTNFKKTKLPTAGVYTDGMYVAQPDSMAIKVKAAGKIGSTGLALQAVNNSNDSVAAKETTEIDLIITQKVGDINLKGILMNRSFSDDATDKSTGATHVRVIASVNF